MVSDPKVSSRYYFYVRDVRMILKTTAKCILPERAVLFRVLLILCPGARLGYHWTLALSTLLYQKIQALVRLV